MNQTLRAVYHDGSFVLQEPCELPEGAEVDLILQAPRRLAPTVADPEERARLLAELTEDMRRHPFPVSPPRWSRDELHERR